MKTTNLHNHCPFPDLRSVASELALADRWDSLAVSQLIRSKCSAGETPAFLFLGIKETALLSCHLAEIFGPEAVSTLSSSYYMGLEVIPLKTESFLATGGRKIVRTLQDPVSRRPAWRDEKVDALWNFRI